MADDKKVTVTLLGEVAESGNIHVESLKRVLAEKKIKDKDLMYLKFRYVHEGSNANNDVFIADELKERHTTAIYKPVNLKHDENNIIGVIYDTEFVDRSDAEDSRAAVNIFAVMYKWLFPKVADQIVDKFNQNTLAVSMETWFDKVECSVCNKTFSGDDEYCEHLKDRHAVAENKRILHGITFGGVGIVERPADKDAVALALAEDLSSAELKTNVAKRLELQKFDAIMYEAQNIMYSIVYNSEADSDDSRSKKQKLNDLLTELKDLIDTINVNKIVKGEEIKMELDPKTIAQSLLESAKAENQEAFEAKFNEEVNNIKATYEAQIATLTEELNTVKAEKDTVANEFNTFKANIDKERLLASRKSVLAENGIEFPANEDSDQLLLEMTEKVFDVFVQTKAAKKEEPAEEKPAEPAQASLEINDADKTQQDENKFNIAAVLNKL